MSKCTDCSRELKTEGDFKYLSCFKCRIKGVKFGFVSVEYGQKGWNNSTVRETQKKYEAMPGVEKVPARAELI